MGRGVEGRVSPIDSHTSTKCFSSTKACRKEGGAINKSVPAMKAHSLGQSTHIHTTPQSAMKSHCLRRVSQPSTIPIYSEAMYVRNPKFHFGYHKVGNSNNCNRLNFNHSLGLSKTIHSTKKPYNNLNSPKAIKPKKQPGRFYPQKNIHSTRKQNTNKKDLDQKTRRKTAQSRRIPRILLTETPGGQAACKHPKDSQVGIQNTIPDKVQKNSPINKTPKIMGIDMPKRKLFKKNSNINPKIDDMVPEGTDLEILLINSCKINAVKVQEIVESFIKGKDHTVMFCMTETKVDSLDFDPTGITLFSAHRKRKEKKGGCLTIGFAEKQRSHSKK